METLTGHKVHIKFMNMANFNCFNLLQGSVQCLQFDDYKIVSGSWDTSVMVSLSQYVNAAREAAARDTEHHMTTRCFVIGVGRCSLQCHKGAPWPHRLCVLSSV